MEKERTRFLGYMINYYEYTKDYMQVTQSYRSLYDSDSTPFALQQMIINLLLVEMSPEQEDLLRMYQEKPELDLTIRQ